MSKILFINPNKWGRGITAIWIPSHASVLKAKDHEVALFDCTFYRKWTQNEVAFNTLNKQYKPTAYDEMIRWNENDVCEDLQKKIDFYKPDIIFWSGLSSHIHGEGEYVNIEYGNYLMSKVTTNALRIAGGLQPMADPERIAKKYKYIDILTIGESEFTIEEISNVRSNGGSFEYIKGLAYFDGDKFVQTAKRDIIQDMDTIPKYDYSFFDEQVLLRPYNGDVVKGVDFELSRGCIYTCSYCVETVIQDYYGFHDSMPNGVLVDAKKYLRNKSAKRIFEELKSLHDEVGVRLIRCQDTNFLSINRTVLNELASLIEESNLDIMLYIETRPEGINETNVKLLKRLNVDGVGMGVEMSTEAFREGKLHRFTSQDKILDAFKLLKSNGIKRTSYNIIGLPDEDESMILETIKFNQQLSPDNMTVAFYSPYLGTKQQKVAYDQDYFCEHEENVDGQLRSLSKSSLISIETLEFYKKYFVVLVMDGLDKLDEYKLKEGI